MIIVSACLAGMGCKYSGKNNNTDQRVVEMVKNGEAVPICPEMLGGLLVPRIPCERVGSRVLGNNLQDFTDAYVDGAKKALAITKAIKANTAILMARSPSCGKGKIYDGTFSKTLIDGNGVFVEMLLLENIKVYTVNEFYEMED